MSNDTSSVTAPTGSSRRAVLRAGAHAAWAVPAVQVATMVPAMAASGPAALSVTTSSVSRGNGVNGGNSFLGSLTIKNNGTAAASSVQVTIDQVKTANTARTGNCSKRSGSDANWGTFSNNAGQTEGTITFSGSLAAGATAVLLFQHSTTLSNNTQASYRYTVTTSNGTGTSGTVSVESS